MISFKRIIFATVFLFSNFVFAARLEDVRILKITPGRDNFELKLQTKNGPVDSYFVLDVMKSDPESFEKLVHIIKKVAYKDRYKLDLDIPSFSASPSGSYYRSEGITFSGVSQDKK
jgi:hypothetical protein